MPEGYTVLLAPTQDVNRARTQDLVSDPMGNHRPSLVLLAELGAAYRGSSRSRGLHLFLWLILVRIPGNSEKEAKQADDRTNT